MPARSQGAREVRSSPPRFSFLFFMTQATPLRPSASSPLNSLVPLLFVALWSTGFIGAKLGLPYVEPLTFLALRFAIVIVLMLAVVALLGITAGTLYQKRFCPSFDLRTGSVIQYLPCAVAMAAVAYATESMAISWTGEFVFALGWLVLVLSLGAVSLLNLLIRRGGAVNVASLFYLTPPTTALIAWAMFGETLSGWALVGMALAVAGGWVGRETKEKARKPPQTKACAGPPTRRA